MAVTWATVTKIRQRGWKPCYLRLTQGPGSKPGLTRTKETARKDGHCCPTYWFPTISFECWLWIPIPVCRGRKSATVITARSCTSRVPVARATLMGIGFVWETRRTSSTHPVQTRWALLSCVQTARSSKPVLLRILPSSAPTLLGLCDKRGFGAC